MRERKLRDLHRGGFRRQGGSGDRLRAQREPCRMVPGRQGVRFFIRVRKSKRRQMRGRRMPWNRNRPSAGQDSPPQYRGLTAELRRWPGAGGFMRAALLLLTATMLAALGPISFPGGERGTGFDDLGFAPAIDRVLVPGGRTGTLMLIEPATQKAETIGGFSEQTEYGGGHGEGITSADEGRGFLFVTDRTSKRLDVVDPRTRKIVIRSPWRRSRLRSICRRHRRSMGDGAERRPYRSVLAGRRRHAEAGSSGAHRGAWRAGVAGDR